MVNRASGNSRLAVLVLGVLAAVALASCGGGGSSSSGKAVIKLGLITVKDGPFADNGKQAEAGAQYAVTKINDGGGVNGQKIELVEADTHGDPSSMANIVRKMATEDKVIGIVGPVLSAECRIGCPLANSLKVPMLSPGAGSPGVVANARPYAFTLVEPDGENSAPAIKSVIAQQGIKTAAIIVDQTQVVTKALFAFWKKTFGANQVQIVKTVTFAGGDPSFAAQVTALSGAHPQALGLAANPPDAARIALEIQRQGLKVQLLGTGILQSAGADFIKAGGTAVEGTKTAAQFDPNTSDPTAHKLLAQYAKDTGKQIGLNGAYAFDAVNIIAQIIKNSGVQNKSSTLASDRDKIMMGLPKVDNYDGMGGKTVIGNDGVTKRPSLVATVRNGQFVIAAT